MGHYNMKPKTVVHITVDDKMFEFYMYFYFLRGLRGQLWSLPEEHSSS